MDDYLDIAGVRISEIITDTGKIATFTYAGDKDAVISLDEAVRIYTRNNKNYKEFIDANMDNPWVRIIISNSVLNNITETFTPPIDNKIMGLKEDIQRKQNELAQLEAQLAQDKRSLAIKPLSEISDAEKIKKFDSLYQHAITIVESAEEKGYTDSDDEHYAYEEVMGLIVNDRKAFWDYFNNFVN